MPRQLALLLCTGFVLFLLRVEARRSSRVSAAMWIPTIWMLLISSKSLAMWFGVGGDNESGSMLDRLVLTALGVAGMAVLVRRRFDWQEALRRHGWLVALFAYMFVSTLWSDITLIALKRWVRDAIVLVMALVIMSEAKSARGPRKPDAAVHLHPDPVFAHADQVLSEAGRRLGALVRHRDVDRGHGPQEHAGSPVSLCCLLPDVGTVSPLAGSPLRQASGAWRWRTRRFS